MAMLLSSTILKVDIQRFHNENAKYAIPQNSHRNFRQQAYATSFRLYLAVFVSTSASGMSLKPISVIDSVTFAVLPKYIILIRESEN